MGGFDPRFGIFDYEDMDLSTTAHLLGIPLVALKTPYLHHISGATIQGLAVDRHSQTIKNREIYHRKWEGDWGKIFGRLENV